MTNMKPKCPPECEVKLNRYEKDIEELKGVDSGQWERIHLVEGAVTERVRIRTLIVVVGIVVSAGLTILGWTFTNLKDGQQGAVAEMIRSHEKVAVAIEQVHDEVETVQQELTRVATQLEERTRDRTQ